MASNWNLFCDQLAKAGLSQREVKVVAAIARKTLGYRKEADRLSASQITGLTGIARNHVTETLERLESRGVITRVGGGVGRASTISLNLHVAWDQPVPVSGHLNLSRGQDTLADKPVPVEGAEPVPLLGHTRGKGVKNPTLRAGTDEIAALRTRAFEAYREASGQALRDRERSALASQVTQAAKAGIDEVTLLAAVRAIARNREFPGLLKAKIAELEANGGPCANDGRDRRALPLVELSRCGCERCTTWVEAQRVAQAAA